MVSVSPSVRSVARRSTMCSAALSLTLVAALMVVAASTTRSRALASRSIASRLGGRFFGGISWYVLAECASE